MPWPGNELIHAGGVFYLPKLDGQSDSSYNSYRSRASFYNATGRTVDAMNGLVFRKPMTVEVPKQMKVWLDDITLTDETLTDFAETCVWETLTVGRDGILVDMPRAEENLQSPRQTSFKSAHISHFTRPKVF